MDGPVDGYMDASDAGADHQSVQASYSDHSSSGQPGNPNSEASGPDTNVRPKHKDESRPGPSSEDSMGQEYIPYRQKYPIEPSAELRDCRSYDIVPTTALIHGASVYSMAASWGMQYLFTGSDDGIIRMYDFLATADGKQLLTTGQRHMLSDTIQKAGVLVAYWENEQPLYEGEYKPDPAGMYQPKLSPVYSLAVQAEAQWICSGLQSGGISLQTVRCGNMEPGLCHAYLDGHRSTVSDLKLNVDDTQLLSGSWDKTVSLWDLHTGAQAIHYTTLPSQVSCIEWQPIGAPIPNALSPSAQLAAGDDSNSGASGGEVDDDKSMGSLFGSEDDEPEKDSGHSADPGEPAEVRDPAAGDGENNGPVKTTTGTVFMTATYNGMINIFDTRMPTHAASVADTAAPPWCMSACWSLDGTKIFAGRRNSTVEEYDIRNLKRVKHTLKFPSISGAVSTVLAMPNGRSLLCGSHDNVRLWDLDSTSKVPFTIIPGHHGSVVSRMLIDQSGSFLVTASGGRGWVDDNSDSVLALAYDVLPEGLAPPEPIEDL